MKLNYKLEDLDKIAATITKHLSKKVVCFNGDMGAGKTTLISAILKAMGSGDEASSPTFSIVNEYQIPNDKIYHFDFYRIDSVEEAFDMGVEYYFESDHWLFMEWSERIEELLPLEKHIITISVHNDNERTLVLE